MYRAVIKKLKLKSNYFNVSFDSLYNEFEQSGVDMMALKRITDKYKDDPIMEYLYNHVYQQDQIISLKLQHIYIQLNDLSYREQLVKDLFICEKITDIICCSETFCQI